MVVMNPDDIALLVILGNAIRKGFVDFDIIDPRMVFICLALWVIWNLIVEDRPKDGLAVMLVVPIEIAVVSKNRQGIVIIFKLFGDIRFQVILQSLSRAAQGTDPCFVLKKSSVSDCVDCIEQSTVADLSLFHRVAVF